MPVHCELAQGLLLASLLKLGGWITGHFLMLWLKVCSLEDHDFDYCIGWPSYCKPCSCALLDVTNFDFSFFKKCEHPTECKQEKVWHCSGSVLATYWNFNLYAVKCGPSQTVLWNWVLCTRLKTALALFILLCKAQKGHSGGKKIEGDQIAIEQCLWDVGKSSLEMKRSRSY